MLEILLVDDEEATRMSVAAALAEGGHKITEASDGAEGMALIGEHVYDVAVCDVRLPKMDGLTLFRKLRQQSPNTAVILMTAYATIPDAVATLREGAYDYVTKPFDPEEFTLRVIGRIAERRALKQELEQARAQLASREVGGGIIGQSPPMVKLIERIDTIAQSDAPAFVTGENGTGKELVARTIHARSPRRSGPFVAVNCTLLPESVLDAELFGHERGAFTGAVKRQDGRFRTADKGTIFLDDVADVPLAAQASLLRVLQEGSVEPLGCAESIPIDVRVISATRHDLKRKVREGTFREDLFYRLSVLDLEIVPLRQRRADLPLLLQYFLKKFTPTGKLPPGISPSAWEALAAYSFPGNVREFEHAIERGLVLARGSEIDLEHLPADIAGSVPITKTESGFRPLALAIKEFERQHLLRALQLASGKRGQAANYLGISRKNLWEKLRHHGISYSDSED